MKKLGKFKMTDSTVLEASEMKQISGGNGSGYNCYCGENNMSTDIYATTLAEAIDKFSKLCNTSGVIECYPI